MPAAQGASSSRRAASRTTRRRDAYIAQLEALHADPARADLAAALGIAPALLDPQQRAIEVRNWLRSLEAERARR